MALLLLTVALAYYGFACLALSQRRHWHAAGGGDLGGQPPAWLPVPGAVLLAASLAAALWREADAGFGFTLWVALSSASAVGLVATLTWKPSLLRLLFFFLGSLRRFAPF